MLSWWDMSRQSCLRRQKLGFWFRLLTVHSPSTWNDGPQKKLRRRKQHVYFSSANFWLRLLTFNFGIYLDHTRHTLRLLANLKLVNWRANWRENLDSQTHYLKFTADFVLFQRWLLISGGRGMAGTIFFWCNCCDTLASHNFSGRWLRLLITNNCTQ